MNFPCIAKTYFSSTSTEAVLPVHRDLKSIYSVHPIQYYSFN